MPDIRVILDSSKSLFTSEDSVILKELQNKLNVIYANEGIKILDGDIELVNDNKVCTFKTSLVDIDYLNLKSKEVADKLNAPGVLFDEDADKKSITLKTPINSLLVSDINYYNPTGNNKLRSETRYNAHSIENIVHDHEISKILHKGEINNKKLYQDDLSARNQYNDGINVTFKEHGLDSSVDEENFSTFDNLYRVIRKIYAKTIYFFVAADKIIIENKFDDLKVRTEATNIRTDVDIGKLYVHYHVSVENRFTGQGGGDVNSSGHNPPSHPPANNSSSNYDYLRGAKNKPQHHILDETTGQKPGEWSGSLAPNYINNFFGTSQFHTLGSHALIHMGASSESYLGNYSKFQTAMYSELFIMSMVTRFITISIANLMKEKWDIAVVRKSNSMSFSELFKKTGMNIFSGSPGGANIHTG